MSGPAALLAVPDQIRVLRAFVKEHSPANGPVRGCVTILDVYLIGAELTAEALVDALPPADRLRRPPQQVHDPVADRFEPRVPRRSGHDQRLPLGRPHP